MPEAAIWRHTGECEIAPIQRALDKHEEWCLGDGPEHHWDYYNSFVIQPAMLAVREVCRAKWHPLGERLPRIAARAKRYAAVQERLISPEGTYPVMSRSSPCRFGAFQHLSLPANDPFWTAPASPWTQKRIWAGEDAKADHAHRD